MFFTYLRRELRRRMRQAIFISVGLALGIGSDFLVLHFEHDARRQDLSPVLHQCLIRAIIATQFGEVVRIGVMAHE